VVNEAGGKAVVMMAPGIVYIHAVFSSKAITRFGSMVSRGGYMYIHQLPNNQICQAVKDIAKWRPFRDVFPK